MPKTLCSLWDFLTFWAARKVPVSGGIWTTLDQVAGQPGHAELSQMPQMEVFNSPVIECHQSTER